MTDTIQTVLEAAIGDFHTKLYADLDALGAKLTDEQVLTALRSTDTVAGHWVDGICRGAEVKHLVEIGWLTREASEANDNWVGQARFADGLRVHAAAMESRVARIAAYVASVDDVDKTIVAWIAGGGTGEPPAPGESPEPAIDAPFLDAL